MEPMGYINRYIRKELDSLVMAAEKSYSREFARSRRKEAGSMVQPKAQESRTRKLMM